MNDNSYYKLGKIIRNLYDIKEVLIGNNPEIMEGNNTLRISENITIPSINHGKNPFIKMFPTFLIWAHKGDINKIIDYCKKRISIYNRPIQTKLSVISDESENKIRYTSAKKKLGIANSIFKSINNVNQECNNAELNLIRGFLYFTAKWDISLDWAIEGDFLKPEGKLAVSIGDYVKKIAVIQINVIKNKGLIKKLIDFIKIRDIQELKKVLLTACIVHFRIMYKKPTEKKNLLNNMGKIVHKILQMEQSLEDSRNSIQIQTGFLIGALSYLKIITIINARDERNTKRENTHRRKFLLPHTAGNLMCYELGFLFHTFSKNELFEFKSRRFARIVSNSRHLNSLKIINLYNYIGRTAIRQFIKEGQSYKSKKNEIINFISDSTQESVSNLKENFYINYPYRKMVASLSEYIINLKPKQIKPNQASMAFMIGYHAYWSRIEKNGEN